MSLGIIACEVLKDEIEQIVDKYSLNYPLVWVERGLHTHPDKLREFLQEKIDALDGSFDDIFTPLWLLRLWYSGSWYQKVPSGYPCCRGLHLNDARRRPKEKSDRRGG